MELVGSLPYNSAISNIIDIVAAQNRVYVGDDANRFTVFDTSVPSEPTPLSVYDEFFGLRFQVKGDYAYLPIFAELRVIDLSNPASPAVAGSLSLPVAEYGQLFDIDINEDLVCCSTRCYAESKAYLLFIDITSPSSPVLTAAIELGQNGGEVATLGELVCVGDDYGEVSASFIRIYSIKDTAEPEALSSIEISSTIVGPGRLIMNGAWLYRSGEEGVSAYDLSVPTTPGTPVMIDQLGFNNQIDSLFATGETLYIATSYNLSVFNISDPNEPYLIETYPPFAAYGSIYGYGNQLYANAGGLAVIDAADSGNLSESGRYDSVGNMEGLCLAGDRLFVDDTALLIIDISDPASPRLDHRYFDISPTALAIMDDLLLVTTGGGIHVLDISELPTITERGAVGTQGWSQDISASGNYAYVADGDNGLAIVNLDDPDNPTTTITNFSPSDEDRVYSVAASGNVLAIANGYAGMKIYDLTTPTKPTDLFSYQGSEQEWCSLVRIHEAVLYAVFTGSDMGIRRYAINDTIEPLYLGSLNDWARAVSFSGAYAVLAHEETGFIVYDLSPPPPSPCFMNRLRDKPTPR